MDSNIIFDGCPDWARQNPLSSAAIVLSRTMGIMVLIGINDHPTRGAAVVFKVDSGKDEMLAGVSFPSMNAAELAMVVLAAWIRTWGTCVDYWGGRG